MAKQNKSPENDQEGSILFISIAILILVVGAWMLFGAQVSALFGILRKYQLIPFTFFFENATQLRQKLIVLNGGGLDFSNTVAMLNKTGEYVRWLYMPILFVLGFTLLNKSVRGKFQKRHTMATLAKQESAVWPEIMPVVGKHAQLVDGDPNAGPYAVAMTEWEFAEKHKLASRTNQKGKKGNNLDREKAREVFVKQLGPRWKGVNYLPRHTQALYAAFVLYAIGNTSEGLRCLRLMSRTFSANGIKGMDTSFVEPVLKEHGENPLVKKVLDQHAYVFPVMATMLQIARTGVVASPLFIWLKTVDRRLWYTLNNVGRDAFHVECAGIAAHWLYEKTLNDSCPQPMVEKAIDGLSEALDTFIEDDGADRMFY